MIAELLHLSSAAVMCGVMVVLIIFHFILSVEVLKMLCDLLVPAIPVDHLRTSVLPEICQKVQFCLFLDYFSFYLLATKYIYLLSSHVASR